MSRRSSVFCHTSDCGDGHRYGAFWSYFDEPAPSGKGGEFGDGTSGVLVPCYDIEREGGTGYIFNRCAIVLYDYYTPILMIRNDGEVYRLWVGSSRTTTKRVQMLLGKLSRAGYKTSRAFMWQQLPAVEYASLRRVMMEYQKNVRLTQPKEEKDD